MSLRNVSVGADVARQKRSEEWNSSSRTRNLQQQRDHTTPTVALGCFLIPFAIAIWWFWSRGFGRKAAVISGLLTNGDNSNASQQHSPANSRASAPENSSTGYEIFDCSWSDITKHAVNEAVDDRTKRWFPGRKGKDGMNQLPKRTTSPRLSPKSCDVNKRVASQQPACEVV